jgi:ABC-type polysaccharide/polyol phosphate export permease
LANILLGCLFFSLIISPLAVILPDICQLTPIFLQISFLASPILFYKQSLGKLYWVSNLNPLYFWIRIAREPYIGNLNLSLQICFLVSQVVLVFTLIIWVDKLQMKLVRRL